MASRSGGTDDDVLDELSRLNNELVHTSRELGRRTAELARANERMNELLGMTAHDLRNPISAIGGLAQTLRLRAADRLEDRERLVLERIERSSRRMLEMVNDLLVLSEINDQRLVIDREPCDLAAVVETSIEVAQVLAERKEVRIEPDLWPRPVVVAGDDEKLDQVVGNLLDNAIKYSHRGDTVHVRLTVEQGEVVLRVRDEGVGIREGEVAGIFEAFSRSSSRPTEGEPSTGLGLAIVRRIVEGHGGTIDVESQVDVGSTFTVRLPVAG